MPPHRRLRGLTAILPIICVLAAPCASVAEDKPLDEVSGFIIDKGWELTNVHCAACHSAKLVTQNRMDRSGWEDTIRLMQAEHGLWDLGEAEWDILDYLSKHYGLSETGSRVRKGRLGP